mmetsp:Transcript_60809/g.142402  ORF Transcript_60809/g.142402 Transcript_60809/m.142402 type:complete len:209 (-) Transcript_60809:894-1520(-)
MPVHCITNLILDPDVHIVAASLRRAAFRSWSWILLRAALDTCAAVLTRFSSAVTFICRFLASTAAICLASVSKLLSTPNAKACSFAAAKKSLAASTALSAASVLSPSMSSMVTPRVTMGPSIRTWASAFATSLSTPLRADRISAEFFLIIAICLSFFSFLCLFKISFQAPFICDLSFAKSAWETPSGLAERICVSFSSASSKVYSPAI